MLRFTLAALIGLVLIQAALGLVTPRNGGISPLDRGQQINLVEEQLLGK